MTNNLAISDYDVGGDYDDWGGKIIADFGKINAALGDKATISATSGTVTLTQDQSNAAFHLLNGVLTTNLIVEALPSKGRFWMVFNATSGAFTVTYRVSGGVGASVTIAQGKIAFVYSDGTDCRIIDLSSLSGSLSNSSVTFAMLADVLDENNLASASPVKIPTQRSVKNYVDGTALSTALPGQAGQAGKFVTTDGTTASWGAVNLVWQTLAVNGAAVAGNIYSCAAGITVTFPASPAARDRIGISTEDGAEASAVTVNFNGKSFFGSTADLVIKVGATLIFEYYNSAWRLAA